MRKLRGMFVAALGAAAIAPFALTVPLHAQQTPEASSNAFSSAADQRRQLVKMARETVEQLRQHNAVAMKLWPEAYGYAVFDATKGGLIVTGVGGNGAAMPKSGDVDDAVFMHVGGAGIGLSAGLANYKLVLLFKDERVYDQFVNGKWDAGVSAQAEAGTAGNASSTSFVRGVKAFRMTDGGLMASADVSAMRFWPSDLNKFGQGKG